MSISRNYLLLLFSILLFVLSVQLVRIERPYLGHFASYQGTVMGSMARNMARENFTEPLLPKTDSIIGGQRSLHLNQYPFPAVIAGAGQKFLGGSLEFWGRLQAIGFNLGSAWLLWAIASLLFGSSVAWISLTLFLLAPFTLIYGQSFMSEASSLFFMLLSFYLLLKPPKGKLSLGRLVASGLFFGLSVTGRIHWILFMPVFCYVLWTREQEKKIRNNLIFATTAGLLPVLWYAHTYFVALEASNIHTNIFMQLASPATDSVNYRLEPAVYLKFFEAIFFRSMTPLALPLLICGGLYLKGKSVQHLLLTLLGISASLLILLLAPKKVLDHDFYLYGCFPFFVLLSACGVAFFLERWKGAKQAVFAGGALLLYLLFSARLFWGPIYHQSEMEIRVHQIALDVKAQTKPQDKLIVLGGSSGIFTFYADRATWVMQPDRPGSAVPAYHKVEGLTGMDPAQLKVLEEASLNPRRWFEYLRDQGADYLVVLNKPDLRPFPDLMSLLLESHELLTTKEDTYYLFRL